MELRKFIDKYYPVVADFGRAVGIVQQNVYQYLRRGNAFVAVRNDRVIVAIESKVVNDADCGGFIVDSIKDSSTKLSPSQLKEVIKTLKDELKGRKNG